MGDFDDGPDSIDATTSANLSEAEKRRLRRRQRILENQGARLNRILKNDPSGLNQERADGDTGERSEVAVEYEEDNNSDNNTNSSYSEIFGEKSSKISEIPTCSRTFKPSPIPSKPRTKPTTSNDPPNLSALLKELSSDPDLSSPSTTAQEGVHIGVQSDGTVILPKISYSLGRILICILALFLSLFGAKQYFVTFVSWEIAFYFINGLPPLPPPNMVMVLAAVMGLQDTHLKRIKKILHLMNCVMVDLSLYLTFVLMPHIVSALIKTVT